MRKKMLWGALIVGLAVLAVGGDKAYAAIPVGVSEAPIVEVVDNRQYADLVIAQVNDYVNVRKEPDAKSEVLGKLYNNSVGHFLEETDGWVKIKSGSVTGYVKSEYVVRGTEALKIARDVETTYAVINTAKLRVREQPNTDSSILGTFSKGDELVVTAKEDGFAKVTYHNKAGYISLEYVDLHTEFVEAESIEEERARKAAEEKARREAEERALAAIKAKEAKEAADAAAREAAAANVNTDSSLGQQVVDYAVQFVGNPYVHGGTSLTNGADCSGFVQSIYAHFDVKLPRTGQRSSGYAVASLDEALPGDLLFYSGHVAIYMGDGRIVHAATPKDGICIGSATFAKIIAIRRIF
ncbi:MAG: SH3 domain-containing protein [Lachnospiraceae bacterium]|nr:SH3 domain-containing protein [Lachnospiraceae bacterium]